MAIGKRIQFFRSLRMMTQKQLGILLGFPEKSADIRIAQYESGSRRPKSDLTIALARVLDVEPNALSVPDMDSCVGLMHTFFALEDCYGLRVCKCSGKVHLEVDSSQSEDAATLSRVLIQWWLMFSATTEGILKKESYDIWRYHYTVVK